MGKIHGDYWDKFNEDMDAAMKSLDEACGNISRSTSNGQSIIQKNGHVEINGTVKSLKINGKLIDLGNEVKPVVRESSAWVRGLSKLLGMLSGG